MGEFIRVHGTETEWGIQQIIGEGDQSRELTRDQGLPYVTAHLKTVPHVGTNSACFCGNGSRFYADINNKWETTTAESVSYLDTIAAEIADEQFMRSIADAKPAGGSAANSGLLLINKRVVSDLVAGETSKTWAHHESYNVPATIEFGKAGLALLGIHLATRNIFLGSGFLGISGRFFSAQKATDVFSDYKDSTTSDKPVVNLRQEHHSNDDSKRIHVTSGDNPMNPWSMRMQVGTTSIVLEMIASGVSTAAFSLPKTHHTNPLAKLMREAANDATGASEASHHALAAQAKLAALAGKMSLTTEQQWVVSEWQRVCADLTHGPTKALDRVEWALRKQMLERYHDKTGFAWDSPEMRSRDRQFDRIGPGSIGLKFREDERIWADWMPSQQLIDERAVAPPPKTRAVARAKFINHYAKISSLAAKADWLYVSANAETIHLHDPYQSKNEAIDRLVA